MTCILTATTQETLVAVFPCFDEEEDDEEEGSTGHRRMRVIESECIPLLRGGYTDASVDIRIYTLPGLYNFLIRSGTGVFRVAKVCLDRNVIVLHECCDDILTSKSHVMSQHSIQGIGEFVFSCPPDESSPLDFRHYYWVKLRPKVVQHACADDDDHDHEVRRGGRTATSVAVVAEVKSLMSAYPLLGKRSVIDISFPLCPEYSIVRSLMIDDGSHGKARIDGQEEEDGKDGKDDDVKLLIAYSYRSGMDDESPAYRACHGNKELGCLLKTSSPHFPAEPLFYNSDEFVYSRMDRYHLEANVIGPHCLYKHNLASGQTTHLSNHQGDWYFDSQASYSFVYTPHHLVIHRHPYDHSSEGTMAMSSTTVTIPLVTRTTPLKIETKKNDSHLPDVKVIVRRSNNQVVQDNKFIVEAVVSQPPGTTITTMTNTRVHWFVDFDYHVSCELPENLGMYYHSSAINCSGAHQHWVNRLTEVGTNYLHKDLWPLIASLCFGYEFNLA